MAHYAPHYPPAAVEKLDDAAALTDEDLKDVIRRCQDIVHAIQHAGDPQTPVDLVEQMASRLGRVRTRLASAREVLNA